MARKGRSRKGGGGKAKAKASKAKKTAPKGVQEKHAVGKNGQVEGSALEASQLLNGLFGPGVVGLQNLKNTCYFNSVVQLLMSSKRLQKYFSETEGQRSEGSITKALREVFAVSAKKGPGKSSTKGSSFKPTRLLDSIRQVCSMFKGKSQHDAHELMTMLIQAWMEEEVKVSDDFETDPSKTFVSQTFGGQFSVWISCNNCGYKKVDKEKFFEISLSLVQPETVTNKESPPSSTQASAPSSQQSSPGPSSSNSQHPPLDNYNLPAVLTTVVERTDGLSAQNIDPNGQGITENGIKDSNVEMSDCSDGMNGKDREVEEHTIAENGKGVGNVDVLEQSDVVIGQNLDTNGQGITENGIKDSNVEMLDCSDGVNGEDREMDEHGIAENGHLDVNVNLENGNGVVVKGENGFETDKCGDVVDGFGGALIDATENGVCRVDLEEMVNGNLKKGRVGRRNGNLTDAEKSNHDENMGECSGNGASSSAQMNGGVDNGECSTKSGDLDSNHDVSEMVEYDPLASEGFVQVKKKGKKGKRWRFGGGDKDTSDDVDVKGTELESLSSVEDCLKVHFAAESVHWRCPKEFPERRVTFSEEEPEVFLVPKKDNCRTMTECPMWWLSVLNRSPPSSEDGDEDSENGEEREKLEPVPLPPATGLKSCLQKQKRGKGPQSEPELNSAKQYKVCSLPGVLMVHLKRFETTKRGRATKLDDFVEFQTELDLASFLDGETEIEGGTKYALRGVVSHQGRMMFGHYVAYVLRDMEKREWFCVSDHLVESVPESRVLNAQAYILMYEKCEPEQEVEGKVGEPQGNGEVGSLGEKSGEDNGDPEGSQSGDDLGNDVD